MSLNHSNAAMGSAILSDAELTAQQEQDRAYLTRGLARRFNVGQQMPNINKAGEEIPGVWSVERTTGEAYEQSHSWQVGVFATLVEAQSYYDAYSAAIAEGERNEHNEYSHSSCQIVFIPWVEETPIFHNLYTIETCRSDDGRERELYSVKSTIYSENQIKEMIAEGDNPHLAAIWEDRSLAVYEAYCDIARRVRKTEDEVIPASVFIPLILPTKYDPEDETEYDSQYETFISFNPENVPLSVI